MLVSRTIKTSTNLAIGLIFFRFHWEFYMAEMTRRGQLTTTALRERTLKRGSLLSKGYSTYIELMRKILPLKVLSLRKKQ